MNCNKCRALEMKIFGTSSQIVHIVSFRIHIDLSLIENEWNYLSMLDTCLNLCIILISQVSRSRWEFK